MREKTWLENLPEFQWFMKNFERGSKIFHFIQTTGDGDSLPPPPETEEAIQGQQCSNDLVKVGCLYWTIVSKKLLEFTRLVCRAVLAMKNSSFIRQCSASLRNPLLQEDTLLQKPSTWKDMNPRASGYEACAVPKCCYHCPVRIVAGKETASDWWEKDPKPSLEETSLLT